MLSLPDYPVRQRDFLLEISRAITARLELSEVLRRVLRASVVMTAGRVGMIALRNEEDDQFNVRAYTGLAREQVSLVNKKLQEILISATTGSFDYEDLNARLSEMAASIDQDLRQSVAMPLVFAKAPLGLLIVFRSYQTEVSKDDLQILHSFADQAAIAVHNAQLYERINHERMRLSAILENSGDGVMILDASQSILRVNRAFEMMTGWSSDAAVGLKQDDVIRWSRVEHQALQAALDSGWPHNQREAGEADSLYVEGDLERRDGGRISLGITYAPLMNSDGKLANIIANIRDITNFRRAQEMQNVFISTISHELRTPVALIKGYAQTLSREDVEWDLERVRDGFHVIEDEADRLSELINDLLTASKIQAERDVKLELSDVQLDELAAHSLNRIRTQSTQHDFVLSFQENFPSVIADRKKLRQVIDNLLTNAIKYSPNGGQILLGGRYNEQSVTVFVRDEGEGIAESDLNKIFDRFFRVDGKLTARTKGTGLGLYLVKAIIEAHEGSIHVKSQPGQGSTFFFTIPRD